MQDLFYLILDQAHAGSLGFKTVFGGGARFNVSLTPLFHPHDAWCRRSQNGVLGFGFMGRAIPGANPSNPFPLILNPPNPPILNPPNIVPICNKGEVLLLGVGGVSIRGKGVQTKDQQQLCFRALSARICLLLPRRMSSSQRCLTSCHDARRRCGMRLAASHQAEVQEAQMPGGIPGLRDLD